MKPAMRPPMAPAQFRRVHEIAKLTQLVLHDCCKARRKTHPYGAAMVHTLKR